MRYEVQHFTLCDGWINTWSDIDDDGTETPSVFATEADAQAALDEYFEDVAEAVASGDLSSGYSRNEFRIVKV